MATMRLLRAGIRMLLLLMIVATSGAPTVLADRLTTAAPAAQEHMAKSMISAREAAPHDAKTASHRCPHSTNFAHHDGSGESHGVMSGDCEIACCPHALIELRVASRSLVELGDGYLLDAKTRMASGPHAGPYKPPRTV